MYPNNFEYIDNRIQDFQREYRYSATRYGLPTQPGLGHQMRRLTGNALISLGARIKPRPSQQSGMATAWGGR